MTTLKATIGNAFQDATDGDEARIPRDPVPPDDSGEWLLVSSVLLPENDEYWPRVIWYWSRRA